MDHPAKYDQQHTGTVRSNGIISYFKEKQPFAIRWGLLTMAIALLLLVIAAWFIKIPAISSIKGTAVIVQAQENLQRSSVTVTVLEKIGDTATIRSGQPVKLYLTNEANNKSRILRGEVSRVEKHAYKKEFSVHISLSADNSLIEAYANSGEGSWNAELSITTGSKRLLSYLRYF